MHHDTRGALVAACGYDLVEHARQELHRPFLDAVAATGDFQFGDVQDVLGAAHAATNAGYRWVLSLDLREWGYILDPVFLHEDLGLDLGIVTGVIAATHGTSVPWYPEGIPRRIFNAILTVVHSLSEQRCPPGHAAQAELFRLIMSALVSRCGETDAPLVFCNGDVVMFRTEAAARYTEDLLSAQAARSDVADHGASLSDSDLINSWREIQRSMNDGRGDRRRIVVRPLEEGVDIGNYRVRSAGLDLIVEPTPWVFHNLGNTLADDFKRSGHRGVSRHLRGWCKTFDAWSGRDAFRQMVTRGVENLPQSLETFALRQAIRCEIALARQDVGATPYVPGARSEDHRRSLTEHGRLCPPRLRLARW